MSLTQGTTASPLVEARTTITLPASSTPSIASAASAASPVRTSFSVSDTTDHDKPESAPTHDAPPTTEGAPEPLIGQSPINQCVRLSGSLEPDRSERNHRRQHRPAAQIKGTPPVGMRMRRKVHVSYRGKMRVPAHDL